MNTQANVLWHSQLGLWVNNILICCPVLAGMCCGHTMGLQIHLVISWTLNRTILWPCMSIALYHHKFWIVKNQLPHILWPVSSRCFPPLANCETIATKNLIHIISVAFTGSFSSVEKVRSCLCWVLQECGRGLETCYRCPCVAQATETPCKIRCWSVCVYNSKPSRWLQETPLWSSGTTRWCSEQRALHVAAELEHLILSPAERVTVAFTSEGHVREGLRLRQCAQLDMLPDTIQVSSIEGGLTVSIILR